jgi:hypothetical protein
MIFSLPFKDQYRASRNGIRSVKEGISAHGVEALSRFHLTSGLIRGFQYTPAYPFLVLGAPLVPIESSLGHIQEGVCSALHSSSSPESRWRLGALYVAVQVECPFQVLDVCPTKSATCPASLSCANFSPERITIVGTGCPTQLTAHHPIKGWRVFLSSSSREPKSECPSRARSFQLLATTLLPEYPNLGSASTISITSIPCVSAQIQAPGSAEFGQWGIS